MSDSSRRRFLRSAVGGSLLLPSLLQAQIRPGEEGGGIDSTNVEPQPPPRPSTTGTARRRARRHGGSEVVPTRPKALAEGSTIAICAPASGVSRGEELDAAAALRNLGFKVKLGKYLNKGYGYLSAKDEERGEEFMGFVRDPEVNAIMAVRGGYGVMRMLPFVDFEEIRRNPKIVMGYSDITALVNPIYQKSGVIAFHGPVASSTFDSYTLDSFRRTVMAASAAGTFNESDEFQGSVFGSARASTIVSGKAQGRLVGGNLSLVTALMGTPYEIDTAGKILFLEEIEEEPYRVDRMLMTLILSGKLSDCAGVALGRFTKCEANSRGGEFNLSLQLEEVVRGLLEPLKIPTVYGLSIGHIRSKLTVPVGGLATMDADQKTITIDEPVVVA